ncbi:MAG: beta-N-acetylhexosaminidase [bacterium]|nr:beta-N-acetylhexosaminidase [bacterium]
MTVDATGGSWSRPNAFRLVIQGADASTKSLPLEYFSHLMPSCTTVAVGSDASAHTHDISLQLTLRSNQPDDEGYTLEIHQQRAEITSSSYAGFLWGLQTLAQLLSHGTEIPNLVCVDRPRFRWRGMHLDVARHFFPVEFVLKFIELLSRYKLNRFHWHLTDDQGWRLPIDSHPLLTEIGAWRLESDGSRYGGCYSRDEVAGVVSHARSLGIEVIPEIDLPGHASALLAACPDLSCDCRKIDVPNSWGVFENTLCPSRESTYQFADAVFSEVADLFDSRYVHIGGDECPSGNWAKHTGCRDRMHQLEIKSASGLQGHFNQRIARILRELDRTPVGWDEILESGAPSDSVIMCWRDLRYAEQAVAAGHETILSPMSHCYFDFYQARDGEPKAIGGHLPLSRVYGFDPLGSELLEANARLILGGQANVWTEYMGNPEHVEYMTIPRVCALSEALWSDKESHDFGSFLKRLPANIQSLTRAGYNHRSLDKGSSGS